MHIRMLIWPLTTAPPAGHLQSLEFFSAPRLIHCLSFLSYYSDDASLAYPWFPLIFWTLVVFRANGGSPSTPSESPQETVCFETSPFPGN